MEDKTTEISAESPAPAPKRKSVFWTCLLTNLLVIGALGGYAFTQRDVLVKLLQPAPQKNEDIWVELSTLKSRFAALEARQLKAEKTTQPAGTQTSTTVDLSGIEAEISALKQSAIKDNSAEIESLKQQISQLTQLQQGLNLKLQEQALHTPPDMRIPAVFQSLRTKALEGAPFEDSYQRFLALAQSQPLLIETAEKLEPYASTGRPTLIEIQRSFKDTLQEYLREKDGVDNSLSGKVRKNLSSFIVVRKLEDKGDSTLAMINRAEQAVTAGDISKAQEELADLPKDTVPLFAAWIEESRAYTQIPAILLKLDQRIADMMMQQTQPQSVPATVENHDS